MVQKSGEQGNKYAITHLGTSLLAGTKVPKDEAAAAYWFRKGAEANDEFSMAMLGYMYEHGLGLPISESIATEWYAKISSPTKKKRFLSLRITQVSLALITSKKLVFLKISRARLHRTVLIKIIILIRPAPYKQGKPGTS